VILGGANKISGGAPPSYVPVIMGLACSSSVPYVPSMAGGGLVGVMDDCVVVDVMTTRKQESVEKSNSVCTSPTAAVAGVPFFSREG